MSDNGHYEYKNCRDLVIAIATDAISEFLNNDDKAAGYWLENSSLAELAFSLIGMNGNSFEILKQLKQQGRKISKHSLVTNEHYQQSIKNKKAGAEKRKAQGKIVRKKWSRKNVYG